MVYSCLLYYEFTRNILDLIFPMLWDLFEYFLLNVAIFFTSSSSSETLSIAAISGSNEICVTLKLFFI